MGAAMKDGRRRGPAVSWEPGPAGKPALITRFGAPAVPEPRTRPTPSPRRPASNRPGRRRWRTCWTSGLDPFLAMAERRDGTPESQRKERALEQAWKSLRVRARFVSAVSGRRPQSRLLLLLLAL